MTTNSFPWCICVSASARQSGGQPAFFEAPAALPPPNDEVVDANASPLNCHFARNSIWKRYRSEIAANAGRAPCPP